MASSSSEFAPADGRQLHPHPQVHVVRSFPSDAQPPTEEHDPPELTSFTTSRHPAKQLLTLGVQVDEAAQDLPQEQLEQREGERQEEGEGGEEDEDVDREEQESSTECTSELTDSSHSQLEYRSTTNAVSQPWLESADAKGLFGFAIALNAVAIGAEVELCLRFGSDSPWALLAYGVQCCLVVAFLWEISLRAWSYGFVDMFLNRHGMDVLWIWHLRWSAIFDVFMIIVLVGDLWFLQPYNFAMTPTERQRANLAFLRVLQLAKLVGTLGQLRISRGLSLMVRSITPSLWSICFAAILILAAVYFGAVLCASALGSQPNEKLQQHFGSIWRSMYTHIKLLTLEQWSEICSVALDVHGVWVVYFILYPVATNFALFNLITGLVMDAIVHHAKHKDCAFMHDLMRAVEAEPFLGAVHNIIHDYDVDQDGQLNLDEFDKLTRDPLFQQILSTFGISLRVEPSSLFEILDCFGRGSLPVGEIAGELLRFRGSREVTHPLFVHQDLSHGTQYLVSQILHCEQEMSKQYQRGARKLERALLLKMEEVEGEAVTMAALRRSEKSGCRVEPGQARLLELLQEAASGVKQLDVALQAATAELQRSSAREQEISADLGDKKVSEMGTQTDAMQVSPH